MKLLCFRILWLLAAPVRAYLRISPIPFARGRIGSTLVHPILHLVDPDASFSWRGHSGARFRLRFRDEIGAHVAVFGSFEPVEIRTLAGRAKSGMVVFDVGANIGLFSVPLAMRVRDEGVVYAFEPYPPNIDRLVEHVQINALTNVKIIAAAAGAVDGTVELALGNDPSRPSIAGSQGIVGGASLRVICRRLDSVWRETGNRQVDLVKIDVEGAEADVIKGASRLLATCHPLLMIETVGDISDLERLLSPYGYQRSDPRGFMPWNHLFTTFS